MLNSIIEKVIKTKGKAGVSCYGALFYLRKWRWIVVGNNGSEIYRTIFKEYPDVMDVQKASDLLGVSTKTVYSLIRSGALVSMKVGRAFRIPKVNIMRYMKVI